jgi:hypothetical protein
LKLIFKSSGYVDTYKKNEIKISHNINNDTITLKNIDDIFSTFFTFLIQNGANSADLETFILTLSNILSNEDDCTLEDCEECEMFDTCEHKENLMNNYASKSMINTLKDGEVKETNVKQGKELSISDKNEIDSLINSTDYVKKFLKIVSENHTLLKTVLKTYLIATYKNEVEKIT